MTMIQTISSATHVRSPGALPAPPVAAAAARQSPFPTPAATNPCGVCADIAAMPPATTADRSAFRAPQAGFHRLPLEIVEQIALALDDDKDIVHLAAADRHLRRCLGKLNNAIGFGQKIARIGQAHLLTAAMDDIEKSHPARRRVLWQAALERISDLPAPDAAAVHEHARNILWATAMDSPPPMRAAHMSRVADILGEALRHLAVNEQFIQSSRLLAAWAPIYSGKNSNHDYSPSDMLRDLAPDAMENHYPEYLTLLAAFTPNQQIEMELELPAPGLANLPMTERFSAFCRLLKNTLLLEPVARAHMLARLQWETYDLPPTEIDEAREVLRQHADAVA